MCFRPGFLGCSLQYSLPYFLPVASPILYCYLQKRGFAGLCGARSEQPTALPATKDADPPCPGFGVLYLSAFFGGVLGSCSYYSYFEPKSIYRFPGLLPSRDTEPPPPPGLSESARTVATVLYRCRQDGGGPNFATKLRGLGSVSRA